MGTGPRGGPSRLSYPGSPGGRPASLLFLPFLSIRCMYTLPTTMVFSSVTLPLPLLSLVHLFLLRRALLLLRRVRHFSAFRRVVSSLFLYPSPCSSFMPRFHTSCFPSLTTFAALGVLRCRMVLLSGFCRRPAAIVVFLAAAWRALLAVLFVTLLSSCSFQCVCSPVCCAVPCAQSSHVFLCCCVLPFHRAFPGRCSLRCYAARARVPRPRGHKWDMDAINACHILYASTSVSAVRFLQNTASLTLE